MTAAGAGPRATLAFSLANRIRALANRRGLGRHGDGPRSHGLHPGKGRSRGSVDNGAELVQSPRQDGQLERGHLPGGGVADVAGRPSPGCSGTPMPHAQPLSPPGLPPPPAHSEQPGSPTHSEGAGISPADSLPGVPLLSWPGAFPLSESPTEFPLVPETQCR